MSVPFTSANKSEAGDYLSVVHTLLPTWGGTWSTEKETPQRADGARQGTQQDLRPISLFRQASPASFTILRGLSRIERVCGAMPHPSLFAGTPFVTAGCEAVRAGLLEIVHVWAAVRSATPWPCACSTRAVDLAHVEVEARRPGDWSREPGAAEPNLVQSGTPDGPLSHRRAPRIQNDVQLQCHRLVEVDAATHVRARSATGRDRRRWCRAHSFHQV